tara:strand:- start:41155 stop:41799 length:645 start_codon:yes stop_codon:yes gene_type:complete
VNDLVNGFETDHVKHSIGGFGGHALRRATHMIMALIPLIYYSRGEVLADYVGLSPEQLVSSVVMTILILEGLRLRLGIVIIGQREYEAQQISALAWGGFAVALALLISPDDGKTGLEAGLYGIPIIFGLTFVDPIMGEIKRKKRDLKMAVYIGLITSYIVWIGCHFWIGTPILVSLLLAPLTVLGELPSLKYIDDNATMVLIPLAALVILLPFI